MAPTPQTTRGKWSEHPLRRSLGPKTRWNLECLLHCNPPFLLSHHKRHFISQGTWFKKKKKCSKNAGSNAHTMKILWRYSWKPDEGKKNRDNNFDGIARGKFSHNTFVSSSCPWKRQIKPSIAEQSFPPQFPGRWLRIRLPSGNCQWRADEE